MQAKIDLESGARSPEDVAKKVHFELSRVIPENNPLLAKLKQPEFLFWLVSILLALYLDANSLSEADVARVVETALEEYELEQESAQEQDAERPAEPNDPDSPADSGKED